MKNSILQFHFNSSIPPALCYIEDIGSYAPIKIAINWNAPLVYVLDYFNDEGLTSLDDLGHNLILENFELEQNYPNPFNPSTTISWQLAESSEATLNVYDIIGREIITLVDEYKPAGKYEAEFNAAGLSSGIYFYKLQAGSLLETKKMVLLR